MTSLFGSWTKIGTVGKAKGLHGHFFLSEPLGSVTQSLRFVSVGPHPQSWVETGIKSLERQNNRNLLRLNAFQDRSAIESVQGQDVWAHVEDCGHELSHLYEKQVYDLSGAVLGTVHEFYQFGGGVDNMEVIDSSSSRLCLVPFVDAYIANKEALCRGDGDIRLSVPKSHFEDLWYSES